MQQYSLILGYCSRIASTPQRPHPHGTIGHKQELITHELIAPASLNLASLGRKKTTISELKQTMVDEPRTSPSLSPWFVPLQKPDSLFSHNARAGVGGSFFPVLGGMSEVKTIKKNSAKLCWINPKDPSSPAQYIFQNS